MPRRRSTGLRLHYRPPNKEGRLMYRTIVATFQGLSDTSALRKELVSVGVAEERVRISSESSARTETASVADEENRSGGIFDWLFGVPDDEAGTYRRRVEQG